MRVKAVFFDMGGTIETFGWTSELRIQATPEIRRRLAEAGIHFYLDDEQLYKKITAGLQAYHLESLQTLEELPPQRVWTEYILADYHLYDGMSDELAEALMLYIETHYFQRSMRPEVPAVLESIQKMGLKIGLISNVNSRSQVIINLEHYGIRHFFDPVVLSSVYGRRKPDPAIFHYAARLANVPTSQCIYVGDRVARDVLGSRRAGFRLAIQILHDYRHGELDQGPEPDAIIAEMTDLVDIVHAEMDKEERLISFNKASTLPVRAMIFDAGDVLYYRPNRYKKLAAFLDGQGIDFSAYTREDTRSLEQQAFRGLISRDQYRAALLQLYGITQPDKIEMGNRVLDEEDNNIVFFDGVGRTLRALKDKGFLLGIITDTALPISVKLGWFESAGFGDVWDSIISSQEIGVRKPDPKIYHAALRQLGIPSSQSVFIGHKTCELDGAHAAGMLTVAFNNNKDARADFYITAFDDLLDLNLVRESVPVGRI